MPNNLQLTPDAMRAFGYRVIDILVDHLTTLEQRPVSTQRTRAELSARLGTDFAEEPTAPDEVLDTVERDVLGSITHVDHPRFYAFVPGPGNFVGTMADALAAGFNVFAGHWLAASGPGAVELQTVDWLRRVCGLPDGAGGLFVSGGSMANLTALATARRVRLGGPDPAAVVYYSDQTHNSLAKGLRVLGFVEQQFRAIPADETQRLPLNRLREAIAADRAAGRRPFCVVANAGTTNTGAVDPLEAIAAVCREEGLWLHVDGAYGAAAALSPRGRAVLRGLELADSITLDPHKWLFQPFEIGCVLVRDLRHLHATFAVHPEDQATYLEDVGRMAEREVVFYEHGIQLTRSFRALKLWMSLRVFGVRAFREAIERGIALAEEAERMLRADDRWEVVTPAQLAVVTFAPARPELTLAERNALVQRAVEQLVADGYAMVTSTQVGERVVLRFCLIHP
ncbi:MAG TPA: aminotransferase class I/II-fold pyridoxal phosphate-dependent enzyme, partial [Gemmatimonadaceae bacterium]